MCVAKEMAVSGKADISSPAKSALLLIVEAIRSSGAPFASGTGVLQFLNLSCPIRYRLYVQSFDPKDVECDQEEASFEGPSK